MNVYLDYSATTPLDEDVLKEMTPYFCGSFGNADSVHSYGRDAAYAVDTARRKVAKAIGANPGEIYFTSGGTEADNWAVRGLATANADKGKRIIVSDIEHAAVLSAAELLKKEGFAVDYLKTEPNGIVSPEKLDNMLKNDSAVLVSVMTANNEIGTLQPIEKLAAVAHGRGALMHTDAVQAVGSIEVDVKKTEVDALSLSAHKFYGPKGVGALYVKTGVKIDKLIAGGHQEKSRRGGTTPVPLVAGLGKAIELATGENLSPNAEKISRLRDLFVCNLKSRLPGVIYNGDEIRRLPQNANFTFPFAEGEAFVMALDLAGIACSSGAACSSGSLEPSHVMKALGYTENDAKKSVRFSFGKFNTEQEVMYCVDKIVELSKKLPETVSLIAETKQIKHNV